MNNYFDVVEVLNALELQTRQRGGSPSCETIKQTCAGVAELIEANAALLAQIDAGASADYRALQENGVVRRSRAALARVGGAA